MQTRTDNENVDVIIMNLNLHDKKFPEYDKLSPEEKIAKICSLVSLKMEEFNDKRDDAMKIFVCHEYAITDHDSRFCNNDARKILKERMLSLTSKYPNLCIIPGTIASKKHFKKINIEKFAATSKKTEEAYENALAINSIFRETWVKNNRIKYKKTQQKLIYDSKKKFPELDDEYRLWREETQKPEIDIIRNSCYIFQGENIFRHDKVMASHETYNLRKYPYATIREENTVFRPGYGETSNPVKLLIHPNTGRPFPIAVEVCMEHAMGYLKLLENEKKAEIKPAIHFMISDSNMIKTNNICSDCFIHVDSRDESRLINSASSDNQAINLYQINLLDPGPLKNVAKKSKEELNFTECIEFLQGCISKLQNESGNNTISLQDDIENIKIQLTQIYHKDPELFNVTWKAKKLGKTINQMNADLPCMKDCVLAISHYISLIKEDLEWGVTGIARLD